MVVAALIIVGYAFYTLTDTDPPRRRPAKARAAQEAPAPERDRARPRPRTARPVSPARGGVPPAPVTEPASAPRPAAPVPGPPSRPEPELSLEDARERFADYMAELDRLESEGTTLESTQWVDLYRRGHETLLPLQQHLDWKIPAQAEELREANDGMRTALGKLEPRAPINPP